MSTPPAPSASTSPAQGSPTTASHPFRAGAVYFLALMLFVDFLVAVTMLVTDKNLQTDFGANPAGSMIAGYYLHWWGVAAIALADLLVALMVGMSASRLQKRISMAGKAPSWLATLWSLLAIVAMVGIVATYQQVGFPSAQEFAKYLFGPQTYTYQGNGVGPYIPWLYDLMLIAFVVTLVASRAAVRSFASPKPQMPTVPYR